jgi:hypothetical protein
VTCPTPSVEGENASEGNLPHPFFTRKNQIVLQPDLSIKIAGNSDADTIDGQAHNGSTLP